MAGRPLHRLGGARSKAAAAPSRCEESAKVARAPVLNAPRAPPKGGVPGMSPRGPQVDPARAEETEERGTSLLRLLPRQPGPRKAEKDIDQHSGK